MSQYDPTALFKLGYGLYVITSNDGSRDNGMICNTVSQVASSPDRLAVAINKANYTHDIVKKTGFMNVNCLTEDAPFDLFKQFGFQSGRDVNKFEGEQVFHTGNGAALLTKFINAFISLKVTDYIDMGSHGLYICELTDASVLNNKPSMTYAYYHANVKPKPQAAKKKGFVCKICGYIYEGDTLPEDFICPLCKHPASDFEPLE
ncbi:NADH-FMN oxidoreductase RutF, flavin reductase (DIM6/NTAB) family [Ruminococcus sp. YE71]|uniref:flavin reductase n=1 Tax=unclassified Ruminococcus TaxID=2608920 RepID=UPI000882EFB9|nr:MULTISPECIES: flavin reductase [unclassified Ruminococcus]SDA23789.1 NADH-FMN oxidoreductase RutF, flavin reductase (DIM6/NTAB) family [Ruminococcus sp. YE78]SFW40522.1 NADH-FMN oxidoreductase RutF, flavin reductase (DIM6/NTAB) family [Ruminococcus sp. YE71]